MWWCLYTYVFIRTLLQSILLLFIIENAFTVTLYYLERIISTRGLSKRRLQRSKIAFADISCKNYTNICDLYFVVGMGKISTILVSNWGRGSRYFWRNCFKGARWIQSLWTGVPYTQIYRLCIHCNIIFEISLWNASHSVTLIRLYLKKIEVLKNLKDVRNSFHIFFTVYLILCIKCL